MTAVFFSFAFDSVIVIVIFCFSVFVSAVVRDAACEFCFVLVRKGVEGMEDRVLLVLVCNFLLSFLGCMKGSNVL